MHVTSRWVDRPAPSPRACGRGDQSPVPAVDTALSALIATVVVVITSVCTVGDRAGGTRHCALLTPTPWCCPLQRCVPAYRKGLVAFHRFVGLTTGS